MKRTRAKHSPGFKAKVALTAMREQESVAEISRRHKIHANIVYKWKQQLMDGATRVFEANTGSSEVSAREAELLQKIGELTVERDFLANGLGRSR
jgi:transposase